VVLVRAAVCDRSQGGPLMAAARRPWLQLLCLTVSGVASLTPRSVANHSCQLVPGVSYDGHDIDKIPVTSHGQRDCCKACSDRQGCTAWTLYQQVCYMKSSTAGRKACADCSSGLPQACGDFSVQPACPLPRCRWRDGRCAAASPSPPPPPWAPPTELPAKWNMSGITFTGGRYCPNVTMGSPAAQRSLEHLASTGANWVAIVVTQYQWRLNSTEIFPLYDATRITDTTSDYYEFITLTDAEVRAAIRQAHSLGLRVLLKPHIDLLRDNKPAGRFWRGDIGGCPEGMPPAPHPPTGVTPFDSAQWKAWFASYRTFLSGYAALAEVRTRISCAILY
jgi:hypothetical protein